MKQCLTYHLFDRNGTTGPSRVTGQSVHPAFNRPPEFLAGGDLNGFIVNENTAVGSIVYTLKARDPDGSRVFYYMSGDSFSVDKDTGLVKLIRPLDRESEPVLDVIITVTDEKTKNRVANTVSLQREVKVGDTNDNVPTFTGSPYAFTVSEATHPFTTVFDGIFVTDIDSGLNAQVSLECIPQDNHLHVANSGNHSGSQVSSSCDMFHVHTTLLSEGKYRGSISLRAAQLNYEATSSYGMLILAKDRGGLSSNVTVNIDVLDAQDEPPKFLNAPYVVTVNESVATDSPLLTIEVRDGDATPSLRRPLKLSIVNDTKKYFGLKHVGDDMWVLTATQTPIDREDHDILANGGVYEVTVRAVEVVNGRESGDVAVETITVMIRDVDDQKPSFSINEVKIPISEDILNNSVIPGFALIVTDTDVAENARFSLSLEDVDLSNPATKAFAVYPQTAVGRSAVQLKVINSNLIDYEEESKRVFSFNVVATGSLNGEKSVSHVTLIVVDANDHSPSFDSEQYIVQVPEAAPPNISIFSLQATDADSDEFGSITYSMTGAGSEKFFVREETGEIGINPCDVSSTSDLYETCLDFETQTQYSLTYTATDGGGKSTSVNLVLDILDVNDNAPQFLKNLNTTGDINEGEKHFSVPLVMKATDRDERGTQAIRYYLKESNLTSLYVDAVSGEIKLAQPAKAIFSPVLEDGSRIKYNYAAVVKAVDAGDPPLDSEIGVTIVVRSERDGAPYFLKEPYQVSIREDTPSGTLVTAVTATDPNGDDDMLRYSIFSGSQGDFVINEATGELAVSLDSSIDLETSRVYDIIVGVTDTQEPKPLTTTTNVRINILDVNNKLPKFIPSDSYTVYISEKDMKVGRKLIQVKATDVDAGSSLKYSIDTTGIVLRDKTGYPVMEGRSMGDGDVTRAFAVDELSGMVSFVESFTLLAKTSVILIPITVRDENGIQFQESRGEVSIYIQRDLNGNNPVFASSNYEISVPEETVVGTTLVTVTAKDRITGSAVTDFEKDSSSDPKDLFNVEPSTGVVSLKKRLDFEDLDYILPRTDGKEITLAIRAKGSMMFGNEDPVSVAKVSIHVQDINDHSPVFSQESYSVFISEDTRHPTKVLTVGATDKDSGVFGTVRFSVSGDGSNLFEIDAVSGVVRVKKGVVLDREIKSSYNLQVTATDNNAVTGVTRQHEAQQKSTSVLAKISLLDVNDNKPVFDKTSYEGVVPENVPLGFVVGQVKAVDPDEGLNGKIDYEIIERDDRTKFFSIDSTTGVIKVLQTLAGKGRKDPYVIEVRATDQAQPPQHRQHSDVIFYITIGDISANDGIPLIMKPKPGEVIYITENSKPGSFVYQVEAVDPDSPNHPNGKVMYRFKDPSLYFDIDPLSGIITTTTAGGSRSGHIPILDREVIENLTLILVAHDLGLPPQESHRVLFIQVNDTDDNEAIFMRSRESHPLVFEVNEELALGSEVARVKAIDLDSGSNAAIVYDIINGNEKDIFSVTSTSDGVGVIKCIKRLDREQDDKFLLTIRVMHPKRKQLSALTESISQKFMSYNKDDFSQIQVEILLKDIDDNPPKFEQDQYVVGVKFDTEVHSDLLTIKAVDPDVTQSSLQTSSHVSNIEYSISHSSFISGKTVKDQPSFFELDSSTGILRNSLSLRSFVGGYFNLTIKAMNRPDIKSKSSGYSSSSEDLINEGMVIVKGKPVSSSVNCKIFVVKDKDFLKFTFNRRPDEIKKSLKTLETEISKILSKSSSKKDTELYSLNFDQIQFLERKDGSLDFESTTACFQLIKSRRGGKSVVLDQKEGLRTLSMTQLETHSHLLKQLYDNQGVVSVEECTTNRESYKLSRSEVGLILVGVFIAIGSLFLICVSSSMRSHLKQQLHRSIMVQGVMNAGMMPLPAPFDPHTGMYATMTGRPPSVVAVTPYGIPFKAPSFISLEE